MTLHRIRTLSASLALAAAPLITAGLGTPVAAQDKSAVADAAKVYGLVTRLPKDTDGFVSFYRLSELWDGFRQSNFVKKILSNEAIVRQFNLDDMQRAWENDPQFKTYAGMAGSLLGSEVMVALPAGFTENVAALFRQLPLLQAAFFKARAVSRPGEAGGDRGMPKEMLPVIEALSDLNLPPVILAVKTGSHQRDIKALIGQAMSQIPAEVMSVLDKSTSRSGDIAFEHLSVTAGKAMPPDIQADMKKDLIRACGDEAKGEALAKKLLAKTAELSWGWLDDYLILSIGRDHSHLNFVTNPADSVLSHADVAMRAAQFAPHKPISFSYTSQKALRTLYDMTGLFKSLISLADTVKAMNPPFSLDGAIEELKKLEAKASQIWPNDPDAMVGAMWWEAGLRGESYGGPKPRAYDCTKPLTLGSLANDSTFLLINGRGNGEFRDRVFGFFEDLAASIYTIFQKEVKPLLPEDVRAGAAAGEMMALPMVKELWKSLQNFRAAMGDEGALLLNLDGKIPSIAQANIPAEVTASGRMPRLAYVNELKTRAKLSESWSGLKSTISTVAAIVGAQTGMNIPTEPVTKTEGGLELFGYQLPMDTGDLWPHTAVSGTHWYLSTSPSFTKELAARTPAPAGPAAGGHCRLNFNALWSLAETWNGIISGPNEKEHVTFAISLARALKSIDIHIGEESGLAHGTFHFSISDVP